MILVLSLEGSNIFPFFQNAMCSRWHVQHYSHSPIFVVHPFGGCQKILNLGEMVCLAHQICDWWFGSMRRCLWGNHSNLNIVLFSVILLYTSTLWGGQFFFFCLFVAIELWCENCYQHKCNTNTVFCQMYDEGLTVNWNSQKTFCRLVYGAQNCFYKKWYLVYFTA